jgi:hypothetical protein
MPYALAALCCIRCLPSWVSESCVLDLSDDGDIRIFDARVGKPVPSAVVKVHRAPVSILRLHPQLNAVISTDARGIIGV